MPFQQRLPIPIYGICELKVLLLGGIDIELEAAVIRFCALLRFGVVRSRFLMSPEIQLERFELATDGGTSRAPS